MSTERNLHSAKTAEDVEFCLKRGDDINEQRNNRTPYLHHCSTNHPEVVLALVQHGCEISQRKLCGIWQRHKLKYFFTGLDIICYRGDFDLLKQLLVYENIKSSINDKTCRAKDYNRAIGYPQCHNYIPLSPLMCCVFEGHTDIFDLLVEYGADVNYTCEIDVREDYEYADLKILTPLMIACELNKIDIVSRLLSMNADLEIVDTYRKTALFYCRCENILTQLLHYGANVNHISDYDKDPLYYFIDRKRFYTESYQHIWDNLISIILRFGADPNRNGDPLRATLNENYYNTTKILLEHGADPNAYFYLRRLVRENNIPMCKLFLEYGAEFNTITLLDIARKYANSETISFLEEYSREE